MIPFGGVIVGVALVGCVACVAWMAAEVVWAVRAARRPKRPDYEVIPDAVTRHPDGWSSVDVGNVRYWVPAADPEEAP